MKRILIYILIIIVASFSFLFSPLPKKDLGPDKDCPVKFIRLNQHAGFRMNCDAIEFTGLSVNPSLLLQAKNRRQSRPLYILSGSLIGYGIYFLSTPFHGIIESSLPKSTYPLIPENKASLYVSHYVALVLINLIVLIIAMYLFEQIILFASGPWKNGIPIKLALLFFLVSNNITKVFFFAPHQQLFNTVLPLLSVWLCLKIYNSRYSLRHALIYGFGAGILLLFYGSFLFLLPVLLLSYLYRLVSGHDSRQQCIKTAVTSISVFFIPLIIWIGILYVGGYWFYSHETEYYRQFIWITDALNDSTRSFGQELWEGLQAYILTFMPLVIPAIFFLMSYTFTKYPVHYRPPGSKKLQHIFLLIFVMLFFFYLLLGFYADRLSYTLAPLLICYSGIMVNRVTLKKAEISTFCIFIAAWHVFLILNEMPHFSDRYYF